MNTSQKVLKRSRTIERQVFEVFGNFYRHVNVSKLVAALNERLRHHAIRFRQQKTKGLGPYAALTGVCEYDNYSRKSEIVISICYEEPTLGLDFWNEDLPLEIVAVIVHELTHREQQKKRAGRAMVLRKLDGEYLALPDEVDAYANDIAYYLHRKGLTTCNYEKANLPILTLYRQTLNGQEPLKRLHKKVYSNLLYLECRNTK